MEIKAKCKYDYDAMKALTHMAAFKKTNPKKAVVMMAGYCVVLMVAVIVMMKIFGIDSTLIMLLFVSIILLLLVFFIYWGLPKIQQKSMAKLICIENEYCFYEDTMKVISKNAEYNGEAEIKYSLITKVMETSKYLFIYQTNNQVLTVDKSTVSCGNMDELRKRLRFYLQKKYIVCKY